jgi:hypothetical protein
MKKQTKTINTIYGQFVVTEPILIDLLNSDAVLRMKKLNQFGISHYVQDDGPYTRYEHSVGVFALLRRYNRSIEEQIAGLLHDASHTVFSHVADYLFETKSIEDSYQDSIHKWFLEKTDVAQIAAKYGYTIDDFMHKSGKFMALEQDLPDLCVDRIEYTLYEHALELGLEKIDLVHERVEYLLGHLHFKDDKWFFDDLDAAKMYAQIPLEFTKIRWASDCGMYTYTMAAKMLQRALDIKLIDYNEIHFGTDDIVWQKLKNCPDSQIQNFIDKICHYRNAYRLSGINDYNMHLKGKFRGVDPYVATNNGLRRLYKLDQDFAKEYDLLKAQVLEGVYIKNLV